MNRRTLLSTLPALAAAPSLLAAAGVAQAKLGICAFSCHQHWQAARKNEPGVRFTDTPGFYRYVRSLGAEGVQTSVRELDEAAINALRQQMEQDGCYFEGDLRLPKSASDLAGFEREVMQSRAAGATVARAVLMGGRRYEVFQTMAQFRQFHTEGRQRLQLAEPILKKHRLKLALENHKDLTIEEQLTLLKDISSEWLGVLVDTGNNIALLDEPHAAVEALAPFALSVHLKDMAVQPDAAGFLLSEVPLGTGMLDLPRIINALRRANPAIVFNLEMATRDPLKVPCLTDGYFATFPERKATHLDKALTLVNQHPPKQSPPMVSGKATAAVLAEEEDNNRSSLVWMRQNIS